MAALRFCHVWIACQFAFMIILAECHKKCRIKSGALESAFGSISSVVPGDTSGKEIFVLLNEAHELLPVKKETNLSSRQIQALKVYVRPDNLSTFYLYLILII